MLETERVFRNLIGKWPGLRPLILKFKSEFDGLNVLKLQWISKTLFLRGCMSVFGLVVTV